MTFSATEAVKQQHSKPLRTAPGVGTPSLLWRLHQWHWPCTAATRGAERGAPNLACLVLSSHAIGLAVPLTHNHLSAVAALLAACFSFHLSRAAGSDREPLKLSSWKRLLWESSGSLACGTAWSTFWKGWLATEILCDSESTLNSLCNLGHCGDVSKYDHYCPIQML